MKPFHIYPKEALSRLYHMNVPTYVCVSVGVLHITSLCVYSVCVCVELVVCMWHERFYSYCTAWVINVSHFQTNTRLLTTHIHNTPPNPLLMIINLATVIILQCCSTNTCVAAAHTAPAVISHYRLWSPVKIMMWPGAYHQCSTQHYTTLHNTATGNTLALHSIALHCYRQHTITPSTDYCSFMKMIITNTQKLNQI